MKIALVTDGIWPYVLGGMQKHSYYLCKYLAANQIHVDLIHFNKSKYKIEDLEFFTDSEKKYIHSVIIDFPQNTRWPGHYLYASYMHSKKIYKYLKQQLNTYDFIYTKGFTGWYLLKQKSNNQIECCPVGVKFHGYEMFQKQPDFVTALKSFLLLRYPVRKINRQADIVFSYGGNITHIITKDLGIGKNKIIEIPSGVEQDQIAETVSDNNSLKLKFLYLGRYERRKGIKELNLALQFLLKQNIHFEFHFIGPIPESKKIKHAKIFYHGEIRDRSILSAKIRLCDVLVCPSYSEGFPNVILEAMASGLAVAATTVGAVEILVNTNTGWIIEECKVVNIQNTILQIMSAGNSEILKKKKASLDLIKNHFTWDKIIRQLLVELQKKF
jgi:glycosyltransferase involved in cell wall biosynthesis